MGRGSYNSFDGWCILGDGFEYTCSANDGGIKEIFLYIRNIEMVWG